MEEINEPTKERLDQLDAVQEDIESQRPPVKETEPNVFKGKDIRYRIETIGSNWVPYQPDWRAPTTDPAIVNGDLRGRYLRIGRFVKVNIQLTAGSSTTFGSGDWTFSVPFTSASYGFKYTGSAYLLDSGTTNSIGISLLDSDSDVLSIYINSNASALDASVPWTWASGDELSVELSYETA